MKTRDEALGLMNEWGARGVPFLFFTDFEGERVFLEKINALDPERLSFNFNGETNQPENNQGSLALSKTPIRIETFALAFNKVIEEIKYGNSFLTNLTFETPIEISGSLRDVFDRSKAKYKLLFDDQFVCFSPESFVQIHKNVIRSFPMKGTIDADIEKASEIILNDPKETAEHVTIVDLIRNDLSLVAKNVRVERFRFIDEIQTGKGELLQVSSEVVGDLSVNWRSAIGDILFALLPAGSICGAPKPKTVDIIKRVETNDRGFYTGVCGLFDGESLDSGVMIRFIEQKANGLIYKSGGGITGMSKMETEYREYIDKIYVPIY